MGHNKFSCCTSTYNSAFLILFTLYALSFFFSAFLHGIFCEEWFIILDNFSDICKAYQDIGRDYELPIYAIIYKDVFFWEQIYRILVFFFYFGGGYFLYRTLKFITAIDPKSRFFLTAFFLVWPIHYGRFRITEWPYTLGYFFFFLGSFLAVHHAVRGGWGLRICAIFTLFLSFCAGSTVVFYLATFLLTLYAMPSQKKGITDWLKLGIQRIDFALLPIMFFTLKSVYFPCRPGANDYNPSFREVLLLPLSFCDAASVIWSEIFHEAFYNLKWLTYPLSFLLISVITLLLRHSITRLPDSHSPAKLGRFILLGFGLLFLGLSTYFLVSRRISSQIGSSQNLLLANVGLAFILHYSLQWCIKAMNLSKRLALIVYAVILTAFVATNLRTSYIMQLDWYRTTAVVQTIQLHPEYLSGEVSLIEDHTNRLFLPEDTADPRKFESSSLGGHLTLAFSDQYTFITKNPESKISFIQIKPAKASASSTAPAETTVNTTMIIRPGSFYHELGFFHLLILRFDESFRPEHFQEKIQRLVSVQLQK